MRVLFCTLDYPPSAAGGAEQQARLQAEELVRRGYRVDVVCGRWDATPSGRVGAIRVYRLPMLKRGPQVLRHLSYLARLTAFLGLRLGRYDLVHVHLANLQADVAVALAALTGRPSYVKVAAGGPLGEIGRLRRVATFTRYFGLQHASLVQAISAEIDDDLVRIGVDRSRIRRIPNGVVAPPATADADERSALRRQLGMPAHEIVVLYVGRMERAKGVHDLIAAWRRISTPHLMLLLVGSPGLKEPVDVSRLPPGVEYRGWTGQIRRYLRASDIFVLPSYAEGMSNSLLEAMAEGLPVVTSPVGASAEIITDGENGVLVPRGETMGLARAIERLACDEALRSRLGHQAKRTVVDRYSLGGVVDAIERAYHEIVRAR